MYYYGHFRSIDTSEDPKGQEYKVVILSGWDGVTNPYPYKTIMWDPGTAAGPMAIEVPDTDKHEELTMADHPFVVTYSDEDLHAPHRCSTAQVSFIQSSFNTDFYDPTGKRCLVALLKRNNNVTYTGDPLTGGYYRNNETGDILYPVWVNGPGSSAAMRRYFVGFLPENIDAFCYTTEWIGFTTPDVLNGEYSRIIERFTLNAQDALSTLKYKKYEFFGESTFFDNLLMGVRDTIISMISNLGVYKNLYISNTVRFHGDTRTALEKLNHQQWNWFDENDEPDTEAMKPSTELDVIDSLVQYAGMIIVPWKDSVVITTPEAIAGGFNTYHTFRPYQTYTNGNITMYTPLMREIHPVDTDTYLSLGHDLVAEEFNGDSMQISTVEVFNSSKVVSDEYPVGDLIPDFGDDHNIVSKGGLQQTNNYYFLDANTRIRWYWEHECFWPNKENYIHGEDVDFYYYPYSYSGPGWGTQPIENPENFTFGPQLTVTPFACILDDGGFHIGPGASQTEMLNNPYNPTRRIYFSTPLGYTDRDHYGDYGSYNGGNRNFRYWQTMVHFRTKPFVANGSMWLAIKGKWHFYCSGVVTALRTIPQQTSYTANDTIRNQKCGAGMAFAPMRIRVGNKYLYHSSFYRWSNSPCDCHMWFDLGGQNYSDVNAFAHQFDFEHTLRNFNDGFYIQLPVNGVEPIDIEVWISRPLGAASNLCNCATLDDFSINVYSNEYIQSRKGKDSHSDTNTEYKANFDEAIINENNDIDIKLSSNNTKGPRYSQVIGGTKWGGYFNVDRICNIATSHSSIPEQGLVENVMAQHKSPYLILTDNFRINDITPISKLRWPSQMGEKRFVPTAFNVDYEYDNVNMTMQEIGLNVSVPNVVACNITRNLRRRRDIINSDNILWREPRVIESSENIVVDDFEATMEEVNEHWRIDSQTPEVSNIMFQPVFEDGHMMVSIPDELDDMVKLQISSDGHLNITTDNDTFPDPEPPVPPIPPLPPVPPAPPVPVNPVLNPDLPMIIDDL